MKLCCNNKAKIFVSLLFLIALSQCLAQEENATTTGENALEGLLNLEGFDFGNLDGGQGLKIDEQMAGRIRALIRHFKQDDPIGIPKGIGVDELIQEPLRVQNLEQTFSGTKMKFQEISVYGLNKFRLDHVSVTLSEIKVGMGLSIDDLYVNGLYQMSAWFTRAKGNFTVQISNVSTSGEVGFKVDSGGVLQVEDVDMDVQFGDIKMDFQDLGFFGSIFQGMVNSVGSFLFDSIKPMILEDAEVKLRGELNRQARSVPQQFPNSIGPVDSFLISARSYIREKGLDPFSIPEVHLEALSYGNFQLTEGWIRGLSSLHRSGLLTIVFEKNVIRITVNVGAEELEGEIHWEWSLIPGILGKKGNLRFTLESLNATVVVSQPANLNKLTTIDKIDVQLGNIAVLSDGMGTLDYLLEAMVNILPNLLRQPIMNALEEPIREYVQDEMNKVIHVERMIEQRLPPPP